MKEKTHQTRCGTIHYWVSVSNPDTITLVFLPGFLDKKQERTSVLQTLKEKCDAPECNPTGCRKARDEHEL